MAEYIIGADLTKFKDASQWTTPWAERQREAVVIEVPVTDLHLVSVEDTTTVELPVVGTIFVADQEAVEAVA